MTDDERRALGHLALGGVGRGGLMRGGLTPLRRLLHLEREITDLRRAVSELRQEVSAIKQHQYRSRQTGGQQTRTKAQRVRRRFANQIDQAIKALKKLGRSATLAAAVKDWHREHTPHFASLTEIEQTRAVQAGIRRYQRDQHDKR